MAGSARGIIAKDAKRLKKKYPNRFNRLKKSERWSKGYMKQASAIYASKHGSSPVGKKRKKVGAVKKRKPRVVTKKRTTRKRKPENKRVTKQVEKYTVERTLAGKRRKRRTRSVGRSYRPARRIGKSNKSGLLIGIGLGALALYLLSQSKSTSSTTAYTLPPIAQTSSVTRNTQTSNIVNYAIAAGLAIDAITKLIDKLNNSTDAEVTNIYDKVNTTGDLSVYV